MFSGWQLWREPLVHFLVAGAFIFALDACVGGDGAESDRIVVTVEQVEQLALLWERTWGRPPTDEELQGTVRDYIKDEVYYREALKLGLDVNDQVIRRRMRQKLEFFVVEDAAGQAPEMSVLEQWYAQEAGRYQAPATFTFDQVYFAAPDETRMEKALRDLDAGSDPGSMGDRISLPRSMEAATTASVAREFGSVFADKLPGLPRDQWSGPVASGLGIHLVKLRDMTPARQLAFDDVRLEVERDWRAEMRVKAEEEAYAIMQANYDIQIEGIPQ